MRFSTNAPLSMYRPKNMLCLYQTKTTYILRKKDSTQAHIVFDVRDWAETEHKFGEAIAEFRPHERKWYLIGNDAKPHPVSLAEAQHVFAGLQVCTLGKGCQKHG